MARQNTTGTIPVRDLLPVMLELMRAHMTPKDRQDWRRWYSDARRQSCYPEVKTVGIRALR